MDLADLQQKINNYITVVSSWVRNVGALYFSGTAQDVTVQLINDDGNVVDSTMPNVAKFKEQLSDSVATSLNQINRAFFIDSINGDDSNIGTYASPFKTITKALESGYAGENIDIRYTTDNNDNYIYEIDRAAVIRARTINIFRYNTGNSRMVLKQNLDNDNYPEMYTYGDTNINVDLYMNIEVENKRVGSSPVATGVFRGMIGSLEFGNNGTINLGDSGVSLLRGHPADRTSFIAFSSYYGSITTNSAGYIIDNATSWGTPVLFTKGSTSVDNGDHIVKVIYRDADSGNPLNVLSSFNFSS